MRYTYALELRSYPLVKGVGSILSGFFFGNEWVRKMVRDAGFEPVKLIFGFLVKCAVNSLL